MDIQPLQLKPLPPSPPPQKEGDEAVIAKGISFDTKAIDNAKALMQNPDSLKDALIGKLVEAPASLSFSNKEGVLAADIVEHLLPSFLKNPNEFSNSLLNNISKKEAPQFLDTLEADSVKFSKESWKALLEDKPALKNVLKAIGQALITADTGTSNIPLLKPLIDKIGDDKSSPPTPAVANKATNSKKLFTFGNAVKLGIVGLAAGTVTELTGVTDFTPLGPNKGATPPPAQQVVDGEAMKAITDFSVKDPSELGKQNQETIQAKIDGSLNQLQDRSISVTAYYGGTLKTLALGDKAIGVQVQADVRTPANNQEGKPSVIIFQPGDLGTQIIIAQTEAPRATPLKQQNYKVTVVNIPLGVPAETKLTTGNLERLFNQ